MKTSIIMKGPIFILLLLALVETRHFYVLFFKKKRGGDLGSSEKRCRMLDFHEKESSGNVGSEPARNNSAISYSFTILSLVD